MNEIQNIVIEGLRVLFLLTLPLVAAISVAGLLSAFLQVATSIHDTASHYFVRLLAAVLVLYALMGQFIEGIEGLAQLALHS